MIIGTYLDKLILSVAYINCACGIHKLCSVKSRNWEFRRKFEAVDKIYELLAHRWLSNHRSSLMSIHPKKTKSLIKKKIHAPVCFL